MKKIYIAGCGGMLGEAFYKQFKDEYDLRCTDKDVNESWISFLDFRDFGNYKRDVSSFTPNYLFHIGAFTDMEFCEDNPGQTFNNNTIPVEYAVKIANQLNIPLLYIGTAGIFEGGKNYYDDWDQPNPLSIYARSKYAGEQYVIHNAKKYLICRAGWMMGGGPAKDKKFIYGLMKQIRDKAKDLFVVNDKTGTPTYTHDFALNVKLLIEKNCTGIYNIVCEGQATRYDVAMELIKILNLQKKVKVIPVDSGYFSKEYFAPRPTNESLVNMRLNIEGTNMMRYWNIALRQYIKDYWKGYL